MYNKNCQFFFTRLDFFKNLQLLYTRIAYYSFFCLLKKIISMYKNTVTLIASATENCAAPGGFLCSVWLVIVLPANHTPNGNRCYYAG